MTRQLLHPAVVPARLQPDTAQKDSTPQSVTDFKDVACRVFMQSGQEGEPRNAMRRLRRFIKGDPELETRLVEAGYRPRTPYLTYRQMRILCEYLS